jgi:nicotinate-nucleotide adenylyltransferase
VNRARRIGLLGGTFDPPHVGHVAAAVNVRHELQLDRVLVMPANIPWQKMGTRVISSAPERLAMVRAAFAGVPGVEVSTIELDRGGESFTADTLESLSDAEPGAEWYVIVGSDIAPSLDTWKRPEVMKRLATVVVYERPGSTGLRPPPGWRHVVTPVPQLDVSSTDLRERVRCGRPIDGLVSPAVADLVRSGGLYADRDDLPAAAEA